MANEDLCHIGGGAVATLLAILSLAYGWQSWITVCVIAAIDVYIAIILVECAIRSSKTPREKREKAKTICELPHREWALLQILLLLVAAVAGFGHLYIKTNSVQHLYSDKQPIPEQTASTTSTTATGVETGDESRPKLRAKEYLDDQYDAIYFSLVTITTLGYGDYVPTTPTARWLVVWELATGVLLLLFAFPLVVSRIANID